MTAYANAYEDHEDAVAEEGHSYTERKRQWDMLHVYAVHQLEAEEREHAFMKGPCASCHTWTIIVRQFAGNNKWALCSVCALKCRAGDRARRDVDEEWGVGTREQAARGFLDDIKHLARRLTRRSRKAA